MANVNNVRTISNQCPKPAVIRYKDGRFGTETVFTVGANEGWNGEMWVPWADSDSDFGKHHLSIDATSGHDFPSDTNANYFPRILIFQHGPDICFVGDNGAGMGDFDSRNLLSGGGGLGNGSGERSLVFSRSINNQLIVVIT